MWGDESEAVAPIIWLYQTVDAQKEEVFFPDLLITLRSYVVSLVWIPCWSDHTSVCMAVDKIEVTDGDCHLIVLKTVIEVVQWFNVWSPTYKIL